MTFFCGEGILEVAKKCKHCGEILDPALRPSVAQSQPVPMPSKKPASSAATKLNGVIGCAGLFTLFICCGGIGQMLSPNVGQQPAETSSQAVPASAVDNQAPVAASQPAPSPARSQAAIESDEKFSAIQMAQVFVKRQLTHPSSASFPWSRHNATRADDDARHVTGTVRAKNSFNLELTYSYAVLIRHLEGTRWSLLDIAINESRE